MNDQVSSSEKLTAMNYFLRMSQFFVHVLGNAWCVVTENCGANTALA